LWLAAKPHRLFGPAWDLGSLPDSYSQSATRRRVMRLIKPTQVGRPC